MLVYRHFLRKCLASLPGILALYENMYHTWCMCITCTFLQCSIGNEVVICQLISHQELISKKSKPFFRGIFSMYVSSIEILCDSTMTVHISRLVVLFFEVYIHCMCRQALKFHVTVHISRLVVLLDHVVCSKLPGDVKTIWRYRTRVRRWTKCCWALHWHINLANSEP